MEWYKDCKLIEDEQGYSVVVNIKMEDAEFSEEIMEEIRENLLSFDEKIREFVDEKFSGIKVNSVKFMVGSLLVATMPLIPSMKAHAAELSVATTQSSTVSSTNMGTVTASKLNTRSGPGTNYSIIHVLYQGNQVKVIGLSGSWYKILLSDGRTGWVSKAYLSVNEVQLKTNIVLASAKSLTGTPYLWGGSSPQQGGFDCSGFTQYVYKQADISLNRISRDQALQGVAVSYKDLKPGDLVFFSFEANGNINHVGIYMGNGQMMHSPKTGDVVKLTDISTAYWQTRFVTGRRVI